MRNNTPHITCSPWRGSGSGRALLALLIAATLTGAARVRAASVPGEAILQRFPGPESPLTVTYVTEVETGPS